jgi:hypothetical protein
MKDKTTPENYMASWLNQMNYPLVKVNLERAAGNTKFSFAQSRFLLTPFGDSPNPTYVSPFK